MIAIYHSKSDELGDIMPIYDSAKQFMRNNGNLTQWTGGYPSSEVIRRDIENGNHYIGRNENGEIAVVFSFIIGEDPTYSLIDDGQWLNDELYGTIHRIASSGVQPDTMNHVLRYCFEKVGNIRIDTHVDNAPMRAALARHGFSHCGKIYIGDGSPRMAFQKVCSSHGSKE